MSFRIRIRLRHLVLLMCVVSLPCALISVAESKRRHRESARERLQAYGIDLSPRVEDPPRMSMAEKAARSAGLTPWREYWSVTVDGRSSSKGFDWGIQQTDDLSCFGEVYALFLIESPIHGDSLGLITNLRRVNCLSVDGCDELTPGDLQRIAKDFRNIKTLKLRNLRHIRGAGDIPDRLYSNCGYLELDGINVTNSDIETMIATPGLKTLALSRLSIEQVARAKFGGRGKVETISLNQVTNVTPLLERMVTERSVLRLYLRNCLLSDRDWDAISKLEGIQFVEINNCDIGDECWTHISRLTELKSLDLANTKVKGDGILAIASLPHLNELILSGNQFNQEGNRELANFPHLSHLHAPDNFTAGDRLSLQSDLQRGLYLEMNGFAGWLNPSQSKFPGIRPGSIE
jgi:hypothetical protein